MTDKNMIEILPAILEKSIEAVQEKLGRLHGVAERVQLDIADGIFVPETSWREIERLSELGGGVKFDLHLMVDRPEQWIERAQNHPYPSLERRGLPSSIFRVTFHYEATSDVRRVIELIRKAGQEVGVALNLETPVSVLYDIIKEADLVLLLSIVPGAQGREFNPEVLDKIRRLRAYRPSVKIGVDGGVSADVAPDIIKAGADVLVCGSWLWKQEDLGKAMAKLQKQA